MVEGEGGGNLNKDLDFRWSHGGRQRGGKCKYRLRFQMVAWWNANGGESLNKDFDFRWSHGGRPGGGEVQIKT